MKNYCEEIAGQEGWPQFEDLSTDYGSDSSDEAPGKYWRKCQHKGNRGVADCVCAAEY